MIQTYTRPTLDYKLTWYDSHRPTLDNRLTLYGLTLDSHFHPKTLFEMWITCLDRVSANSEKGRGSEWAVRVVQRLQSRFGQSGAVRELNLVQIVEEVSAIQVVEGVSQALSRLSLFLAGAVATFCGDYGEGLRLRPHGQKHVQTLALDLC